MSSTLAHPVNAAPVLRRDDGHILDDACERWFAPASAGERSLLESLPGPILDVGCGPGRIVVACAEVGIPALGIDSASGAITATRRRGGTALLRSIFDPLPAEGRWGSAVLADGNIGIGADPVRLLRRLAAVVRPGGLVVAEVNAPGEGIRRHRVRIERARVASAWFPWVTVSADAMSGLADQADLEHTDMHLVEGRWFVVLTRPDAATSTHEDEIAEAGR